MTKLKLGAIPDVLARETGQKNDSAKLVAPMPLEKGCTEPIFKVTDGTADRGLLNVQCCSGLAQAAILGGSHKVAEMASLYSG